MSAERPNIISAKNDVLHVTLPFMEGTLETYVTADVSAGATSLTVKDNARFQNNDYIVLGTGQQSEIVKVGAAPTYGSTLTIGATTFAHGVGTKVTLIRYNQVAIYGSTSSTDAAPTIIGSAENLDVRRGYNEIKASTAYAYYYARFYNSQTTTYSAYSDSIAATGLTAKARGEIKREFLSIYNEKIDDLITEDWINRSINRWQRELAKRRNMWSCLHEESNIETVQDQQAYALPSNLQEGSDSIMSVKFYNQPPLTRIDHGIFNQITHDYVGSTLSADVALIDVAISITDTSDFADSGTVNIQGDEITYTAKTSTQITGVTGITATHTSGDEVWQTRTAGQPNSYYVDGATLYLDPMPDSSSADRNIYLDYWKRFDDLVDDQDETVFGYPENCYYYLNWQLAIRRKLPVNEQAIRQQIWREDLEERVVDDPDVEEIRLQPQDIYRNPY